MTTLESTQKPLTGLSSFPYRVPLAQQRKRFRSAGNSFLGDYQGSPRTKQRRRRKIRINLQIGVDILESGTRIEGKQTNHRKESIMSEEFLRLVEAANRADKIARNAQRRADKVDNALAVDDPKRLKAIEQAAVATRAANEANIAANEYFLNNCM